MPKSWHGAGERGTCRHGIEKDRQVIIWVAELVACLLVCYGSFFGSNPESIKMLKMGDIAKEVANIGTRYSCA